MHSQRVARAIFSGALWTLCRDPEQKRSLVDWLTEVLAPEIADLDFIHVQELDDVMAMLVERDGKRISNRSLVSLGELGRQWVGDASALPGR